MLRIGIVRVLAVLIFGIALPYALFRLSRVIGATLSVAAAIALGLAYGALKADGPWSGDGLSTNLRIMAVSAAVVGVYSVVSLAAARAIAKRL